MFDMRFMNEINSVSAGCIWDMITIPSKSTEQGNAEYSNISVR